MQRLHSPQIGHPTATLAVTITPPGVSSRRGVATPSATFPPRICCERLPAASPLQMVKGVVSQGWG